MVTRKCRVRRRGPYGPSEPWLLAMTQFWDNKASLLFILPLETKVSTGSSVGPAELQTVFDPKAAMAGFEILRPQ